MTSATVTTKGQIVIPSKIRRRLQIQKGTKLYIEEKGEEIIIKPLTAPYFQRVEGILHTKGRLARALLRAHAQEKRGENRR
jgi:AbrB family looped-hinge helix DNA binding protein